MTLQLASSENDFNKIVESKYKTLHHQHDCIEFVNMLEIAVKTIIDDFIRITDYAGNKMILYIKNHRAYVPQCEEDYSIEVIQNK